MISNVLDVLKNRSWNNYFAYNFGEEKLWKSTLARRLIEETPLSIGVDSTLVIIQCFCKYVRRFDSKQFVYNFKRSKAIIRHICKTKSHVCRKIPLSIRADSILSQFGPLFSRIRQKIWLKTIGLQGRNKDKKSSLSRKQKEYC